jgi:hypothetical protein
MSNLILFKKSILNNGGASYNLLNGQLNPTDGFMVSIANHETILKNNWMTQLQYHIASYIKEKAYILCGGLTNQRYFIGAWVENDELYLDISTKVTTREEAERIARDNNQEAYYDNGKQETIYI